MMCYPHNCKYTGHRPLDTDAHQLSSLKSQTEKRCQAELSRVAAILEIMSECLNAWLVGMTANQYHIHAFTHIGFKYWLPCLKTVLCSERQLLLSHLNHLFCQHREPCHPFISLSLFLLYLQPPSSAFILPFMTFPSLFCLSVAMLAFSYITPPILVSPLHQSCTHAPPPAPPLPLLPSPLFLIICLLSLSFSASARLSLIWPWPTAYPSLLCSFITFFV